MTGGRLRLTLRLRGPMLAACLALIGPAALADSSPLERALATPTPPEPLPALELEIEPEEMAELRAFRERIFDLRTLPPDKRVWIRVTLVDAGERYPARLRIRGDLPVHWRGSRQSYRIKLKKRLYRGMKELNLILPADKHYGIEVLQTRISEELALPFFPSRFVTLRINGAEGGLYLESEHPTREYLQRTGLPLSSIFTFSAWWTVYYAEETYHALFERPDHRDMPPLKGIGQIKQRATWERDRPELAQKQLAYVQEFYRLVNRARVEEIRTRVPLYLDLNNFARYVALHDFFGSRHAMELADNTRLYLDPTSGKFQFMPWDTSLRPLGKELRALGGSWSELLVPHDGVFRALLDSVPGVRAERDRVLRGLVADGERHRAELARIHSRLIRLDPDNTSLRDSATSLDKRFGRNVETLREYFERADALAMERRP